MTSTPRHGHGPIEMRKVEPRDERIERVGDYYLQDGERGLELVLAIPHTNPRGFIHSVWTIGHPNDNGAKWSLVGDPEKLTLTPSLHAVGVWHGWVKQGRLFEA